MQNQPYIQALARHGAALVMFFIQLTAGMVSSARALSSRSATARGPNWCMVIYGGWFSRSICKYRDPTRAPPALFPDLLIGTKI